ncbi:hypothetical protein CRYUN_Cryun24cG0110900 [Craigia yunnanensis]
MEAFEKPAKTLFGNKSLDQDAKPLKEGSKGAALTAFTVEKSWENGVRVSIKGKEGSCLDEDGEGLEDSEMNGVSSLLQMKESVRNIDVNGGIESVKGFGTLLGAVDKSKEIGIEKVFPSGDDGVSLVDIHGEAPEIDGKERRDLDDKENGGGMILGWVNEIDYEEGDDDGGGDWGSEFSAGDFVWGKIRSHPWWPGQVYNPSDASDYAVKVRLKGRLLVAYFGDSSFSWCDPSQLKPFDENFEDLSKLSNSKNFLNAIQTSVDEIGRLVELKMTCSCVPKENCTGLDRPLAANAGIKKGVLVPEGGIRKLSIGVFEPEKILGKLKQIAQAVCMSNLLECTVLKGWVSAFNRSIGRYQMPMSHEPLLIPELEENLVVDMSDYSEAVEVPLTGPVEEDWISSSGGPKFGQCGQTLLMCPEIPEDDMNQRRKQKSIAEIIKGELNVQARKDEDAAPKGTNSGEQASSSRRKKMKGNNKANGDDGSNSSSIPRKRKGTELSGSLTAREGKMSSVETDAKEEMGKGYSSRGMKKKSKGTSNNNNDSGAKEDTNNHPVSAKRKVSVGSVVGNSGAETKDLIESGSLLRERKKSKYLSPPYTSPTGKLRKMDLEADSLKVSNDIQLGEQMTKATDNLVRSPLVLNYSDERNQLSEEVHAEQEASNESSFHTPKQYLNRMIDLAKIKTPANEVLIEVRSVALSPQYRRKNNSFEIVVEFLSEFRSSVYRDGSNYKIYNQFQPRRKRKSPDSVTRSSGKHQNLTDHVPSGHRSKQKKVGKNEETNMDQSKPRQATRASPKKTSEESKAYNSKIKQPSRAAVIKKNYNEVVENASLVALFVTFGPGSSLPTKDDLIRIYGRYGALNMEDTDMFYNNFCARVVFLRSSDAEQALNSSQSDSPFGASNVSFRLRFHWAASAHEHREIPSAKPSPLAKDEAKRSKKSSASENSADHTSHLNYIRHKLEILTSMLEISDEKMSSDMKSKLQSEIKGLLEKVNTMVESSS